MVRAQISISTCKMILEKHHLNVVPNIFKHSPVCLFVISFITENSSCSHFIFMSVMRLISFLSVVLAGIPQVVILTKIDETCPEIKEDLKIVYKSAYVKEKVQKTALVLFAKQK